MKKEIWKDIEGYEGLYQVSNMGRIKSFQYDKIKGKILKPSLCAFDYLKINLRLNNTPKTEKLHRLVAKAFIPNPENKPQINHKDGNKQNNRVDNLEWCTDRENKQHAVRMGLHTVLKGEDNPNAKLTWKQANSIRKEYKKGNTTHKKLGKKYSIGKSRIGEILLNKAWVK